MIQRSSRTVCLLLALNVFAGCSRSTGTEAPVLMTERSSKLEEEKSEVMAAQKKSNSEADILQRKIEQLEADLRRSQQMTDSEKLATEQELAALKQQKADLDATLKAQAEKQAKLEEELRKSNSANSANQTAASTSGSGFPLCGPSYYGVTFQCGSKTCAKSDANYQNICELTPQSRPASVSSSPSTNGSSGYPLCGSVYYGTEFTCNGKRCGKSDPNYVNICEITASSRPATATSPSTTGLSGYPYCPSTFYGTIFDCNGRRCAKSDAAYQNICEIR